MDGSRITTPARTHTASATMDSSISSTSNESSLGLVTATNPVDPVATTTLPLGSPMPTRNSAPALRATFASMGALGWTMMAILML